MGLSSSKRDPVAYSPLRRSTASRSQASRGSRPSRSTPLSHTRTSHSSSIHSTSRSRPSRLTDASLAPDSHTHNQSQIQGHGARVDRVTADIVDLLPQFPYAAHHDQGTCLVCCCDFEAGEQIRVLPCVHSFHAACVDRWLRECKPECPVCHVNLLHGLGLSRRPSSIRPHTQHVQPLFVSNGTA